MLSELLVYFETAFEVVVSVFDNFIMAIGFLLSAPSITSSMAGFMPTFISVSLIHVVVISVLKAIFGR